MADSSQDIEDLHKVEEDTERIRELTEKGKEQYEECINAYRNTIDQAWGNVQSVLDELTDCDVEQLSNLEQRLHECYEKYSRVRFIGRYERDFTFKIGYNKCVV